MLRERLRRTLIDRAGTGKPITYNELADRLGLMPPQRIHRLTRTLEALMAEDAAAGRPLLASLCVSRLQQGMPARGFFLAAAALGLFAGEAESEAARTFHAGELKRVAEYYRHP